MHMRFKVRILVIMLAMSIPIGGAAKVSAPWRIGEEREIDAGLYITLIREVNGWRIWREEGSSGKNCVAVKPANGVRQPNPLSSYMFYGGYPAITISETTVMNIKRINWSLIGTYNQPTIQELRNKGERFFYRKPDLFDQPDEWDKIFIYADKTIEVHVVSWKYPSISIGFSENYGMIDLGGLLAATQAMKTCNM